MKQIKFKLGQGRCLGGYNGMLIRILIVIGGTFFILFRNSDNE